MPIISPHRSALPQDPWRLRLAVSVSVLLHALLLSLSIGGDKPGPPGIRFPWEERRLTGQELRVVLAPGHAPAEPELPVVAPVAPGVAARQLALKPPAQARFRPELPAEPTPTPAAVAVGPATPVAEKKVNQEGRAQERKTADEQEVARAEAARAQAESQQQEQQAQREAARQDAQKQEQARQERALQEQALQELARQEQARQEQARQEQARQEQARQEQARQEQSMQEQARQEQARQEQVRQEQVRQEQAKQEQARQEKVRHEQVRQEQARQEQVRHEQVRQEQARQEQARQEQARHEQVRQEQARQEQARQEQARQEQARQEQARQEQAGREREAGQAQTAQTRLAQGRPAQAAPLAPRAERLRAIAEQLARETAQRNPAGAAPDAPQPTISGLRRGWLFGRADVNQDLVAYAEAMSRKIEMNMTLDVVREAVKQPHTQPVVTVAVRADGSVEKITFVTSSGVPAIDDGIRKIIASQAPFGPFPPGLARQYDVVEIRRTWLFDVAVRLQ